MNATDLTQIKSHGLTVDAVERQIENFNHGFAYLPITAAAAVGKGITVLDSQAVENYANLYAASCSRLTVSKFVPASGAATRMFKDLFEFAKSGKTNSTVDKLMSGIDKFAFYKSLCQAGVATDDAKAAVDAILNTPLQYGIKPKGQILFHNYPDAPRTAFEEHLCEGGQYAAASGMVKIHFTVSPEHQAGFEELAEELQSKYESRFGVKYQITMSTQKSSTDTIAVDMNNEPFRNDDGSLLFRPAGHGALIENLNAIESDLVFIKNIDNVTTESRRTNTVCYKKALAGLLIEVQGEIFELLGSLESGKADIAKAVGFVENRLQIKLLDEWKALPDDKLAAKLCRLLDRPIRVCGMVRNEGEPGGGPYMARSSEGFESLQIAEASQIDPRQSDIMKCATHFNPVDLICGVKDRNGRKYDLSRFVDHSTGFISVKSKNGRELKAQELPGLWNGAMADWNTLFVEVPADTFSPVKVVTDLLRAEHQ